MQQQRQYYARPIIQPINIIRNNKGYDESEFRVHFYLKNLYIGRDTQERFLDLVANRIRKIYKVSIVQINQYVDDNYVDVSVGLAYDYDALELIVTKNKRIFIPNQQDRFKQYDPVPSKVFQSYINQNKHLLIQKMGISNQGIAVQLQRNQSNMSGQLRNPINTNNLNQNYQTQQHNYYNPRPVSFASSYTPQGMNNYMDMHLSYMQSPPYSHYINNPMNSNTSQTLHNSQMISHQQGYYQNYNIQSPVAIVTKRSFDKSERYDYQKARDQKDRGSSKKQQQNQNQYFHSKQSRFREPSQFGGSFQRNNQFQFKRVSSYDQQPIDYKRLSGQSIDYSKIKRKTFQGLPSYQKRKSQSQRYQSSQSERSDCNRSRNKRQKSRQINSGQKFRKGSPNYSRSNRVNSPVSNRSRPRNRVSSSRSKSSSSRYSNSSDSFSAQKIQIIWVFGVPTQFSQLDVENKLKEKKMNIISSSWKRYEKVEYLQVILKDCISQKFLNQLNVQIANHPVIIIPSLREQKFIQNQLSRYQVTLKWKRHVSEQKVIFYADKCGPVVAMVKTDELQDKFIVVFNNRKAVKKFHDIQQDFKDCTADRTKNGLKIGRIDRIFTFEVLINNLGKSSSNNRH